MHIYDQLKVNYSGKILDHQWSSLLILGPLYKFTLPHLCSRNPPKNEFPHSKIHNKRSEEKTKNIKKKTKKDGPQKEEDNVKAIDPNHLVTRSRSKEYFLFTCKENTDHGPHNWCPSAAYGLQTHMASSWAPGLFGWFSWFLQERGWMCFLMHKT